MHVHLIGVAGTGMGAFAGLLKAAGHKVSGQPGSWSNGTAVVRMQLKELVSGEIASQLVMEDGCGLSRNNRVTPEMLARWLRAQANRVQHRQGR